MSEMDLAKKIFGSAANISNRSNGATSRVPTSTVTNGNQTTTRRGTVQKVKENGYISILLDGSLEPVDAYCETPVAVGQRVTVIYDGGTMSVYAMKDFVDDTNGKFDKVHTDIIENGNKIKGEVANDIKQVENFLNDFKKNHQLTDSDINSSFQEINDTIVAKVEGVVDDVVGTTYAKKTELEAGINGIRAEVSETYETKTDAGAMKSELQSSIKQTEDAIKTEVSERKEAVNGAIKESKAYTDTQADSISQAVEEKVMNSVGEIYATKSEITQTSDGLKIDISKAVEKAESAQSSIDNVADIANANSKTVNNINAYFDFGSDDGGNPLLTLGSSGSEMKSEFSNKALSFKSNGNEIMRLEGTTSTVSANKVKMGNYQWQGEGEVLRLVYVG